MALTRQDVLDVCAIVSQMLNERAVPVALEGRVVAGSYRPEDGTVEVIVGDTDAAAVLAKAMGDPLGDQINTHPRVPLATHDPNDQYGPRGGEAAMLVPSQSGYVAKLYPDAQSNDAPGPPPFYSVQAPSGERWIIHRNAAGNPDGSILLTNDGPTSGDGLGGTSVGGTGALTQQTTSNPNLFSSLNATAQQAKTQVAPGLYTIWDGAGNALSHVVPAEGGLGLGALFSAMSAGKGAINNDILTVFGSNINNANLQTLINLANAMVTAGIPNASNLIPLIVMSLISQVSVPAGSSIVRVLS